MKAGAPGHPAAPDVNRFRVLDFLRAGEVLAATQGIRDELKRALGR